MNEANVFNHQGYVVVKKLFDRRDIEKLTTIIDRIHSQWLNENHADFIEHKLVNMHSLTSPRYFGGHEVERLLFFQTIASNRLTHLLDDMFGDGLYFHNTQLFFNPFENTRPPYWHRDMQYTPIDDSVLENEQQNMLTLHVRIPLVHEKRVELIPGTHKRWDTGLERNVRLELSGHKNSEDLPGAVLIELAPGDVLIFNAQMIHRGNYRLNKSRKALDLCLGKQHPFTSQYIDESTLPNTGELDQIANNQWYKVARDIVSKSQDNSGVSAKG